MEIDLQVAEIEMIQFALGSLQTRIMSEELMTRERKIELMNRAGVLWDKFDEVMRGTESR